MNRPASVAGVLRAWSRHENAPRTTCRACQFESSDGYPPSHAPGCPDAKAVTIPDPS